MSVPGLERLAALALLALASAGAAAQDFSRVEIRATRLNDTTYMLTGAGGNENFGRAGALLIAHENVRKRMGGGTIRGTIAAYRDMLAGGLARIEPMVRDGRRLEEIVAAKPTAPFDAKWGKGFLAADKFAGMVATELLRNR